MKYDRVPASGPVDWKEFIDSNTTSHNFGKPCQCSRPNSKKTSVMTTQELVLTKPVHEAIS